MHALTTLAADVLDQTAAAATITAGCDKVTADAARRKGTRGNGKEPAAAACGNLTSRLPSIQGTSSPHAKKDEAERNAGSRVVLPATPGALAAAQVLSGSLPAGGPGPSRKSTRNAKPSAKLQQMRCLG